MAFIQQQPDSDLPGRHQESVQQQDLITKTGVAPPDSKTRIYAISPREYKTLRKKLENQSNESVLEKNTNTEIDVLDQVGLKIGHSRMLTAEEFDVIYKATDNVPSDIPLEQWLILKKTTFPYSVLSMEEKEAIQAAITKIIDYALLASLNVLLIYIVLKYFVGKTTDRSSIVQVNSGGGDIVLDGIIDKRSGGVYLDSAVTGRSESLSPNYIEAYDVLLVPPESGNIKEVTIILDTETGKWIGFPHSLHYFSSEAGLQLLKYLKQTIK